MDISWWILAYALVGIVMGYAAATHPATESGSDLEVGFIWLFVGLTWPVWMLMAAIAIVVAPIMRGIGSIATRRR